MYPSSKHSYFGTFVKKFELGIAKNGFDIDRIVVQKKETKLQKLNAYLRFFINVIFTCNFKSCKYQVIYVHYVNHSLLPFLFVRKSKLPLFIVNAHGGDVFYESTLSKLLGKFSSKIIRYSNRLVVPSNYFKNVVAKRFNYPPQNIFISPSGGVNFESIEPKSKIPTEKTINIGYLGRIDKDKGWDTFIKAMAVLKQEYFDIQIHIAGGGKEIHMLDTIIHELKIEYSIIKYGTISHEQINSFFEKIELFVFPSRRSGESLGLVALEALASGTPVIANNNGAVEDFIINGKNGYLYHNDSIDEMVVRIQEYLNLSNLEKRKLSLNARESVRRYSFDFISKKMSNFIRNSYIELENYAKT